MESTGAKIIEVSFLLRQESSVFKLHGSLTPLDSRLRGNDSETPIDQKSSTLHDRSKT